MQAIPAIDDHGKEGAYRSKMAALCPRLAAGEKSIHDALTNAAAWQQAAAGSVPELPSDLQQNAKRISGCLLYHVCLYAALTLYRNPPTGSSLPAAKAQVQKLADVLGTMETALPEEQRGSLPVASDAIVKEMWLLVCPVQPQTHLPQPTSGEGLQRGWVVLRAHAGTGQGHRRGGGGLVDPREANVEAKQARGEEAMQMEKLKGKKRPASAGGGGGAAAKQAQRKGPGLQSFFGQVAGAKQRSDGADASAGEVGATSPGSSGRAPPTPAAGVV